MTAMVHSISSNKKASLDDSKHETIATLLQKSLLRCSSLKKFSANQDINCHLLIDHMKELVRLLLGREASFDASMVNVEQLLETLTKKIGNTLTKSSKLIRFLEMWKVAINLGYSWKKCFLVIGKGWWHQNCGYRSPMLFWGYGQGNQ